MLFASKKDNGQHEKPGLMNPVFLHVEVCYFGFDFYFGV